MPFRKKILYYGLMLLLTLLALEGMARIAYYAAYGQGYGGGPSLPVNSAPPPNAETIEGWRTPHPFYGYSDSSPSNPLNTMPPRQRREGLVVIGLLGGSVAKDVKPFLQAALNRRFAANELPRRPVVLGLAWGGAKQPQQVSVAAATLLLGGEVDLVVNLDGYNEVVLSEQYGIEDDLFPFFPVFWDKRVRLTGGEILLAGHLMVLHREQARRSAVEKNSPLRWSAVFGIAYRYRRERAAARIIHLNRQLAATEAAYSLEKHGPRSWPQGRAKLLPAAARVWYRGSLALARLAELAGAEYYHFLQPNQYVPGSKPLSAEEQELADASTRGRKAVVAQGYPLLRAFNRVLPRQGINYFDLTGIFAARPETLYIDKCCHLNDRGNELLAAEMARRLEPALQRLGGESPAQPVSALAAARRPPPDTRRAAAPFQVYIQEDGKQLRYIREVCAPEDPEPAFFLHLIPRALADLPPHRAAYGFAKRDFSFTEGGGRFAGWQCTLQFPLPDYPLAALRTGQFVPGQGDLWSVELIVPVAADQLRADYAALSAAEPIARDYFYLYDWDNRLVYLRETCAAADTAAPFFLHIIPENPADLPAERRDYGFVHAGFAFAQQGGHFDGKCLASVALPEYPIKEMRTGQHIPGQGDLWSVALIAAPDYAQLRADYAALSAANPVERTAFDLYLMDNRLLYLRENCADADTAAGFFLHIVPADVADLPAERQAAGFAYGGFEFVRQGGNFDGKCLAAVSLPEYSIKEMRTGQFVPGQGDLWSAVIAAP